MGFPEMKYRLTGYASFLGPDGYTAIAPPWGTLSAIGLNSGEYVWKINLGEYPELAAQGIINTGSENYGRPILTAGGLLFIGATNFYRKFRAFDKESGELLWETTLPFAGNATPATYEVRGRQYRQTHHLALCIYVSLCQSKKGEPIEGERHAKDHRQGEPEHFWVAGCNVSGKYGSRLEHRDPRDRNG